MAEGYTMFDRAQDTHQLDWSSTPSEGGMQEGERRLL
jgi:hypothetical protein